MRSLTSRLREPAEAELISDGFVDAASSSPPLFALSQSLTTSPYGRPRLPPTETSTLTNNAAAPVPKPSQPCARLHRVMLIADLMAEVSAFVSRRESGGVAREDIRAS
jgi:hypothetical protein